MACEWRAGAGRAGQLAEFGCSGCRSGGGGGRCCQARRRPRRLRRVRELQPCRQRTQSPRSTDINPDTYNTFTTSEAASRLGGRLCRHGRSRIRQRASTRLNPWLDDVPVLPTPPTAVPPNRAPALMDRSQGRFRGRGANPYPRASPGVMNACRFGAFGCSRGQFGVTSRRCLAGRGSRSGASLPNSL